MEHYAVIGHPIDHSLSPIIHTAFAKQINKPIYYDRREVAPDKFQSAINDLQNEGFRGVNVTAPFKEAAVACVHRLTDRAKEAGAVNTITFYSDGLRIGDNTDGVGLVTDLLANVKFILEAKKILILGAGGAVRGIVGPLLRQEPDLVIVANRDPNKAMTLATFFESKGRIQSCAWESVNQYSFDLIINGTSASVNDSFYLNASVFHSKPLCYDMTYGKISPFLRLAQSQSALIRNGVGMLIEQAAEAFYGWHGFRPQAEPLFAILEQEQANNYSF